MFPACGLVRKPRARHHNGHANSHTNSQAYPIFERDVTRVCEYFAAQGISRNPKAIAHTLWEKYYRVGDAELMADRSRGLPLFLTERKQVITFQRC